MKKTLLALAALTAFAGVASAQSSVTLFGVVDLNARNVKNGNAGSIKSLSQDGNASSRLGFRGVEDLGGGLRGGFWLEAGVNPDTGSTNMAVVTAGGSSVSQLFNRRSTVSLMGGFGEVRLGRDYTPTFWNYTVFDPFGTNGVGSMLNPISTLHNPAATAALQTGSAVPTLVRANNTIGYFLPAMGGLYGQVQVAAGENVTGGKYIGGRIGYAAGPVNVAAAYGRNDRTGTMVDDYSDMNLGGSFNVGFMTIMGNVSKREYGRAEQKTALIGATVPLGAGTFKASYVKSSGDSPNTALTQQYDATQMAVGFVYDLSKRTALYTHASRVNNDGNATNGANFVIPGGPAGMGRGQTSTGYEFGIRHSF